MLKFSTFLAVILILSKGTVAQTTYTWTGLSNTAWNNAANWSGGAGYPTAATDIAIINSGPNMPIIGSGLVINLSQLSVGASASLSMTGSGSIVVNDAVVFSGTASFASTTTFTYASSVNPQTIIDLPYGTLGISGTAAKIFPAITTVTGDFTATGALPDFNTNSGTFVYDAGTTAIQRVAATNYYNLTVQGNRNGNAIRLGNGTSNNIIDIANNFTVTATNYSAIIDSYNTVNFSSTGTQAVPGFTYGFISNSGNGPRIWDNQGSTDPTHVVNLKSFDPSVPLSNNITTGSKVKIIRNLLGSTGFFGFLFYDLELSGDYGGNELYIVNGQTMGIAGTFTLSATNFKLRATTNTFNFNGTGAQTIPAFKANPATNTPAWQFNNLRITNANRIITLAGGGVDTINISGTLTVPPSFTPGNGFVVAGSTINFIDNAGTIPALLPVSAGSNNYNNVTISGGTRSLVSNLLVGGNVSLANSYSGGPVSILDISGNTLTVNGTVNGPGFFSGSNTSNLILGGAAADTLNFVTGNQLLRNFTLENNTTATLGTSLDVTNGYASNTGTILDINGNTLTIGGNITGTGSLGGSNSSNLTLGGAAGTVNFATGKQVLKNLTLVNNATAILGTPLDITGGTGVGTEGTVSVTSTAVLTTGGNLTLKSTVNGTARVATGNTAGGYIVGDVTIERYVSDFKSWRFLAAPAFGQTIKQSWQENQAAGVNPGTGFGTNISSSNGSWLANGFDFQTVDNSLLTYNPASNVWDAATNTNVQISGTGSNKSYLLYFRGDRSITPVDASSTSGLVRIKGTLFQGDLPAVPVTAGQFAAIGNNYASAIDFTFLNNVNVDQSFSALDYNLQTAKNLGAWVTFSAAADWMPVPSGGSYASTNTRIESGQAFMVHSSGASGTVTLPESSKLSGSKLVARPSGTTAVKQILTTNVYNTNGGIAKIVDGNAVVFSLDYLDAIDQWDAVKVNNFGDNFGLSKVGQTLIVDARQPVAANDTVFFNMTQVDQQPYRLEFNTINFDNSVTGTLEDLYLNTSNALNMTGTTTYDYTVTGVAASAAANRFRVVFATQVLPVTFTSVSANEKNLGIAVEWKVESELNIASYDVEKSADGRNFTKMFNVAATGQNTGGSALYNWLDTKSITGDNFYRIRSISRDGKSAYSKVVKIAIAKGKSGFTVFPNPVTDGMVGLQMNNIPSGVYRVRIINSQGQMLSNETINHTGGNSTKTIKFTSVMVKGTYQLEITGADKKVNIVRILVL